VGDSKKRWYDFHGRWYCYQRRSFFVNYWYAELMVVNERAINLVKSDVLESYALMAPPEFFAELYTTGHGRQPMLKRRFDRLDPDLKQFLSSLGTAPSPPEALV